MQIAVINDTHIGARGENPHVDAHFFRFWNNIFFPHIEENDIRTVFHLGDVVDRRKFINFKIWNNWRVNFFDRLSRNNIDFHILLGNHDIFHTNTSDINAMDELLVGYETFTIHRLAETRKFGRYGLPICFVPWLNESNEPQIAEELENTPAKIIFGHLQIAGFEMDRGNLCHDGLDRSVFSKFDAVYTGHFHHRHSQGNIHYLGNQYEITWADYDDPRGFHVFDTETCQMTFIENPHKLFHKIQYSDDTMDFQYWKTFDYEKYRNSYVKIVVLKKQNPYMFDTVLDNLYKHEPIDVTVVEDFSTANDATEVKLDQAEDVPTLLSRYIDTQNLELNKDELKGLIKELYVEALNTEATA